MGARVSRVVCPEQEGFEPDPDAIEAAIGDKTKLIIINSPCNPTGAVYAKSTIRAIAELALRHGIIVLSDEIYEDLIFSGAHYSPASEYDNIVTVSGFSKTYAMTGWRLGYVTGPPGILEGMIKIYQHSTSCVTAFAQAGATEALRNERSQSAAEEMIKHYATTRELMLGLLEESEFLECRVAQGAFYCFPSYTPAVDSATLSMELLEKVHVATVPGMAFGKGGEYHLRLSYAVSEDDIIEALGRIEDFFQSSAGKPS
jgi:aspartate aminotransferase